MQPRDRRISKYVFVLVVGLALAATLAAQQQQATPQQTAQPQAAPQGPPPAEQVFKNIQVFKGIPAPQLQPAMRRDSLFYSDFDLKQAYSGFRVRGIEKIGDRDAYLVMASAPNDVPERLYFDTQTGLLLRRVQYNDSVLGRSPLQTDYEDYREVDGIKRAFVQRQARPDFVFVIKWDAIKHNVPVDDARFEEPAAPAPAPAKP